MSRFQKNPNLEVELNRTPQMLALVKLHAEAAAKRAKSIAPVGDSAPGEHYKDMIEAEVGFENGKATGRVNAKKFTSGFIEFGTRHNRPHAVLRRAVESLGLKLRSER